MPNSLGYRIASYNRITKETKIQISLSLDGGDLDLLPNDEEFVAEKPPFQRSPIPDQTTTHHASQITAKQQIWIWTGVGFLDHMLHAWAKHAGWSLRVRCKGDLASMIKVYIFFANTNVSQSILIILRKTLSSPWGMPSTRHSGPALACNDLDMPTPRWMSHCQGRSWIYRPARSSMERLSSSMIISVSYRAI